MPNPNTPRKRHQSPSKPVSTVDSVDSTSKNLQGLYEGLNEHQHQVELFVLAAVAGRFGADVAARWMGEHPLHLKRSSLAGLALAPDDRWSWLHAVPNGGSRGSNAQDAAVVGGRMKAEGVRAGVADICLPVPVIGHGFDLPPGKAPSFPWCGLYLEMKRTASAKVQASGSMLAPAQKAFGRYVQRQGYCYSVGYGYVEGFNLICAYLNGKGVNAKL